VALAELKLELLLWLGPQIQGVSNHWTGFSTGMQDWNMGLECETGQDQLNCYINASFRSLDYFVTQSL